MITSVFRDIFRVNLGVKRTERCIVFTDRPSPQEEIGPADTERRTTLRCLGFLAAEVGKGLAGEVRFLDYPATGSHGTEPPAALWEAAFGTRAVIALQKKGLLNELLNKRADRDVREAAEKIVSRYRQDAVDAVVALSYYSTSHTLFRRLLTDSCGARYASMPLFEISMVEGPMNVDWKALARLTKSVSARISKAERIEISTANGSKIAFSVEGRKAVSDTGILTRPGAFGNLPAGESFIAPVEGTAKGTLILEWAPTRELSSPVTLEVSDGRVQRVSGSEPFAAQLRQRLSERSENGNIAEFGVGTNSMAQRPDSILESEKIRGTIHIALGDNSTFGGTVSTPFHLDFVFFRPTVRLIFGDGGRDTLMSKGSLKGVAG